MEFDRFSIALLVLCPDRPRLDKEAEAELQDAHMAHLADLHEAGYLLAAGPLLGGSDEAFRGGWCHGARCTFLTRASPAR